MKRTLILAVLAAGSLLPLTAQAAPAGCTAISVGVRPVTTHGIVGECRFVAVGPTTFAAAAQTPFIISSSRDRGKTWVLRFRWAGGGAVRGDLGTVPGEIVRGVMLCQTPLAARLCKPGDYLAGTSYLGTLTLASDEIGPTGCTAAALGVHPMPTFIMGECRIIASGPTTYAAAALTPFVVSASRDGGTRWRTLFRWSGTGPVTGTLSTRPGEIVRSTLLCWNPKEARLCAQNDYLAGTLYAGSVTIASS